jgi:tetratricopeptide (TPR) repeat protein
MKLFFRLLLVLFIFNWSLPVFSQMNADSINKLIDSIRSNDTSANQIFRDLQRLGRQNAADSLSIIAKKSLTLYSTYSNPDSALAFGIDALDLAKKMNSKKNIADCYQQIGEVLRVLGNYPKAVEFTLNVLPLAEELKDTLLLIYSYNQLGVAYNGDGDFEKARGAIFKALSLINYPKKNYQDSAFTELAYTNLAEIYANKNILDSALFYGKKAEIMDGLIKRNWGWVSIQLARIYTKIKNEHQALIYYNKAFKAFWLKDSIDSYNGMAELFLSGSKMDSAIVYANNALAIDISHIYLPEMLTSSAILSNAYEKAGNKDSTLKYLKLNISLKDSIFNLAKVREVQSLSLEEQLRQQDIAAQERKAEENRVRNLQLLAIGIFIPIFFIGVLLLSRTKVKPRVVEFLGILSLLLFFEFITDLIYPFVSEVTKENPIWEILFLVILAALLEPLNFKLEHWVKERLVHKPVTVPVPVLEDCISGEAGLGENI